MRDISGNMRKKTHYRSRFAEQSVSLSKNSKKMVAQLIFTLQLIIFNSEHILNNIRQLVCRLWVFSQKYNKLWSPHFWLLLLNSAVAGLKLLGGPNLHFYCSTLVFNIYFLEFAKLLGGPGPPRPLPTLRHCSITSKILSLQYPFYV